MKPRPLGTATSVAILVVVLPIVVAGMITSGKPSEGLEVETGLAGRRARRGLSGPRRPGSTEGTQEKSWPTLARTHSPVRSGEVPGSFGRRWPERSSPSSVSPSRVSRRPAIGCSGFLGGVRAALLLTNLTYWDRVWADQTCPLYWR